jgi:S1-C subfamily serine protease
MRHPSRFIAPLALAFSLSLSAAENPAVPNPPALSPSNPPTVSVSNPPPVEAKSTPAIEGTVVKVFSTMRLPDPYKPWTKQSPSEVTGTGVIIEGKRILTNAHVVLYASQVQVQAHQSGDKISATVVAISPGIDLAVLKLDDESLFDTHPALARASVLPDIKEPVLAYGYPTGGNSLSITKGIVSRIEFTSYNLSVSGLRIQIDAAINPGNSGGPAIAGDKMIGLAFSNLGGAQNIGYIIPNEEIELFLADVADGSYDGKPAMFDELQTLEHPALRTFLKLEKGVEGIIVHEPYSTEPGYPLKEWDVITKIGDAAIDDQGMIKIGANLRVRFQYLIQQKAKEGKVPLTIVRSGKAQAIELPVRAERPMLIYDLQGGYPPYFVFGPLVFSTATAQFMNGIGGAMNLLSAIASPLATRRGDKPAFAGENLVIVSSPFFPHRLSKGYSNPISRVVDTVNGKHVNNLNHLVELLRDAKDDFITLEFAGRGMEALVFSRKDCLAATEEILTDNGVRYQGSPDTLAVWKGKPPTGPAREITNANSPTPNKSP